MYEYLKGAFFGAAVGDVFDGPVEFTKADEIRAKYGVGNNTMMSSYNYMRTGS